MEHNGYFRIRHGNNLPKSTIKNEVMQPVGNWITDEMGYDTAILNEFNFQHYDSMAEESSWMMTAQNADGADERVLTCLPENGRIDRYRYQCWICSKIFSRRSTLWNHKKIHSPVRCYGCAVCGKRFKWKNSLGAHARVHLKKAEILSLDEIPDLRKVLPRGISGNRSKPAIASSNAKPNLRSGRLLPKQIYQQPKGIFRSAMEDQERTISMHDSLDEMNYETPVQPFEGQWIEDDFQNRRFAELYETPINGDNVPKGSGDFEYEVYANFEAEDTVCDSGIVFDMSYFNSAEGAETDFNNFPCYYDPEGAHSDSNNFYAYCSPGDEIVHLEDGMLYSNEREGAVSNLIDNHHYYYPSVMVMDHTSSALPEPDSAFHLENGMHYPNEANDDDDCHFYDSKGGCRDF